MDAELRNALWDVLHLQVWRKESNEYEYVNDSVLNVLFSLIWHKYRKLTIDRIPDKVYEAVADLREVFFACEWNEVYDFLEFVAQHTEESGWSEDFQRLANVVLERELSGFRFADGILVQISGSEELKSIDEALANTAPYKGAQEHLKAALTLIADRKSPDFRNSIKESISAVESICQVITGDSKATLGAALKQIEKHAPMHPALKKGLDALYGYTSDSDGIRHAMLDESKITFDEAKFMLVTCTAFVNYLIAKRAS